MARSKKEAMQEGETILEITGTIRAIRQVELYKKDIDKEIGRLVVMSTEGDRIDVTTGMSDVINLPRDFESEVLVRFIRVKKNRTLEEVTPTEDVNVEAIAE